LCKKKQKRGKQSSEKQDWLANGQREAQREASFIKLLLAYVFKSIGTAKSGQIKNWTKHDYLTV